jgi:thiamine biosynthesis lipoprotein
MASPCEVLIESDDATAARRVLSIVAAEARRIEAKFSRYRSDSVVSRINRCDGDVEVDDETARLLDYAGKLFDLSGGKFDVTSGVLRRTWTFDGSDRVPDDRAVEDARRHVGWQRVRWRNGRVALEPGMEIDFGGIGKE